MLKYLLLLFFIPSVYSSTITPIVILPADQNIGEITITNDTKLPQNYLLSVDETSFPDGSEKINKRNSRDIKLSQTMLYLSPGKVQKIQFSDKGSRDKERYFLIKAQEQIYKKDQVYATAVASRVFVRPSEPIFKYDFDGEKIQNESNGYLMLMIDEQCGEVQKLTKLIKPGDNFKLPELGADAQVAIEFNGHVKQLVNKCNK